MATTKESKKVEVKESRKEYFIKGTLVFNAPHVNDMVPGRFDDSRRVRVSLKDPKFKEQDMIEYVAAYAEVEDDQYVPNWVKEGKIPQYINYVSGYPIRVDMSKIDPYSDMDDSDVLTGAYGILKVRQVVKDGAVSVYPIAFKVLKNGQKKDDFEGCDW